MLADAGRGDWILCQVTSNPYSDHRAIMLTTASFATGSLSIISYARPGKLFTANSALILAQAGTLKPDPFKQLIDAVVAMLYVGVTT